MKPLATCGAFFLLCINVSAARGDEPRWLREAFVPGYQFHVRMRVDLTGNLSLPPEKDKARTLQVTGKSAIDYDERIMTLDDDKKVKKTIRTYARMDFERKIGDELQHNSLRPEVRRLVVLRRNQVEVPFAPAGPLTWGEIDMVRTDVFTPALAGLLPERAVQPGDSWQAAASALQELTDLEKIEEGSLTCQWESTTLLAKRRLARITLKGSVRGLGEDGTARHQLEGFFFFDLESNHIAYLSLKGTHSLLDKMGNAQGKVEGTFVLTRQPHSTHPELSDDALRGLVLEPNEDNTLLLYDNPDLGIRLLYPRRWRLAGTSGRQIGLDEARGSGLLLTVDGLARVPGAGPYLQESRTFLQGQKATILGSDNPRQLQGPPRALETFTIQADVAGQKVRLDYYVIRQNFGGATLAARLLPRDLPEVQRDVERIARSIEITRQQ